MITLKVRTTSWSIRSSRETRKITTVVLKLSFSYNFFFLGLFPSINSPKLFCWRAVRCYVLPTWPVFLDRTVVHCSRS